MQGWSRQYPELTKLCEDKRKGALESIRILEKNRKIDYIKRKQTLLRFLRQFSGHLQTQVDTPVTKASKDIWSQDDLSLTIQALYSIISRYSVCGSEKEHVSLIARLRLAIEEGEDTSVPTFGLMFLMHPHDEEERFAIRWRDTRVYIDRRYTIMHSPFCQAKAKVNAGKQSSRNCKTMNQIWRQVRSALGSYARR